MHHATAIILAAIVLQFTTGSIQTQARHSPPADKAAIARVLDSLHQAAAQADGDRYFSLYANDAVFFGTDATERWSIAEFREYAQARFDTGTGWTYRVCERNIFLDDPAEPDTAWFDESLHNEKYGDCRGTGVLIKRDDVWKIAQYNLTIPIPNDLALDVVSMIRKHEQDQ